MTYNSRFDTGLDYLLALHGVIQVQTELGHWVKFEAFRVEPSEFRPHGIKYCLSLHAPNGTRLVGFDNAHPVKPSGSRLMHIGQSYPYDHWHRHAADAGILYEFETAYQLIQDFFKEVERALKKECG